MFLQVTLSKRGRPSKHMAKASEVTKPDSQRSDAENASPNAANGTSSHSVEGTQLGQQACDAISQTPKRAENDAIAIASMVAVEPPANGGTNIIAMDQTLHGGGGGGVLQGCIDGSIITLEQAADGTYYVIQPFLGKVEELSSQCFVDSVSCPEDSVRRTLFDHVTLVKSAGMVHGGQATLVVNEMPGGRVARAELSDGLHQVIFTSEGSGC